MDVSHSAEILPETQENQLPDARSSLRHWLAAIDGVLRAVEETVWRLRRETAEACHASRVELADWVVRSDQVVQRGAEHLVLLTREGRLGPGSFSHRSSLGFLRFAHDNLG